MTDALPFHHAQPAPSALLAAVRERLERYECQNARMLLAVSGGADSVAMLQSISRLAEALDLELVVGTVDHGLRPEAREEALWVSHMSATLGIPCEIARLAEDGPRFDCAGGSLQQWARDRRYEVLGEMARRTGCRFVATAHTRCDQAETVLMRVLRGTGIQGLSGISALRPIDAQGDIRLLRPMLDVSRGDVEAYLEALAVTWVEDPSNQDPRFARVRMRRQILPVCEEFQPGASLRIAALAEEARAIHEFVEAQFADSKYLIKTIRLCDGVKVEREELAGLPRPLWSSVLRQAIRRVRGDLRRLDRSHLEPIAQLAQQCKSTGALALPGQAMVCLDRGDVFIFPRPLPPPPTGAGHPSPMGAGQWRLRFAALGALAEVTCGRPDIVVDLEVRVRRPGDRLYGSRTKFKELLMKRKVPRPYRDFVPVLVYGEQVIAAPAILSSRMEELSVHWLLETTSPVLDLGLG